MKVIDASYELINFDKVKDVETICRAYCLCYGSEVPDTYDDQCRFIRKHRHHESPLEHSQLTVLFNVNRGISHELVRHRHCAYSQESTRYCNYSKGKFGEELTFIKDSHLEENGIGYDLWKIGRNRDESEYLNRIKFGERPEEARGCLPNDLATKIMVSANYREWRSIFKLRCDIHAHYQMREIMIPLLHQMQAELPCVFDDIEVLT